MKIYISVQQQESDDKRLETDAEYLAKSISNLGYDLVASAPDDNTSQKVIKSFVKKNRNVEVETLIKEKNTFKEIPGIDYNYHETIFERAKAIYDKSDILLIMPGDIQSTTELLCFLEAIRSDDSDKKLVIYNKDNHYSKLLRQLLTLISHNFSDESIYLYLNVYNNTTAVLKYINEQALETNIKQKIYY